MLASGEPPAAVLPAAVARDSERLLSLQWTSGRPIDGGPGEVVAVIELVGEGIEVARCPGGVPAAVGAAESRCVKLPSSGPLSPALKAFAWAGCPARNATAAQLVA